MKITPVQPVNTAPNGGNENSPPIKMDVNRTPGRLVDAQIQELPGAVEPAAKINQEGDATEVTKPLSPQYAALAKQRRALQLEREAFAKEKASATAAPDGSSSRIDLARLKSDPLGVLFDNGITWEQLTEATIAYQGSSELHALKAELKALKEGVDEKLTTRDQQQEQQALAEMKRTAQALAARDDAFELVRETKSIPEVMRLIERTWREKGEVLDVSEALSLVEEELVKESLKLASLKKVQGKLHQPQQRQMRTLTNKDTAQVSPLSAKQRALQAFLGTLKR